MSRCDLPNSRYSQLNGQNLDPKFAFGNHLGHRPQKGRLSVWQRLYHHAKFHGDRCHRRRDICNQTKYTKQI